MVRFSIHEHEDDFSSDQESNDDNLNGSIVVPHAAIRVTNLLESSSTKSQSDSNEHKIFTRPNFSEFPHSWNNLAHNSIYEYYHYYKPPSNHDRPHKRAIILMTCLLAVLGIVIHQYIPPPPPPYDHWNHYLTISTKTIRDTMVHIVAVISYVLHGSFHNMRADITFYVDRLCISSFLHPQKDDNRAKAAVCHDDFTSDSEESWSWWYPFDAHDMQKYLSQSIVGQDYAIHLLSQTMAQLAKNIRSQEDDIDSEHSSTDTSSSLLSSRKSTSILLTGPTGVGKSKTIELIIDYLGNKRNLSVQNIQNHDDCLTKADWVLELDGMDYMFDPKPPTEDVYPYLNSSPTSMVTKILNHVQQHRWTMLNHGTSIIVIKHIELLSDTHQMELFRLIQSSTLIFRKESPNIDSNLWTNIPFGSSRTAGSSTSSIPVVQDSEISLANTVFLLTSDIGSKQIFDIIRREGSNLNPFHNVVKDSNRINHMSVPIMIPNEIREDIRQHSTYFHLVDYIIPYGPLQYSHMKQILKEQINIKNSHSNGIILPSFHYDIEFSDAAIQFFVGPKMMSYLQVFMEEDFDSHHVNAHDDTIPTRIQESESTSSPSSFVFAARGGHDIPWKQIRKMVDPFLQQSSFYNENEFIHIDINFHQDNILFRRCTRVEYEIQNGNSNMNQEDMICYDQMEMNMNQIKLLP